MSDEGNVCITEITLGSHPKYSKVKKDARPDEGIHLLTQMKRSQNCENKWRGQIGKGNVRMQIMGMSNPISLRSNKKQRSKEKTREVQKQ